nr:deoxynucleotidyltransferase terminal-interacting protein 2 [Onthophagus taurus]
MDFYILNEKGDENIEKNRESVTCSSDEIERLLNNYNDFIKTNNKQNLKSNEQNSKDIKQNKIREVLKTSCLKNLDSGPIGAYVLTKREKMKLKKAENDKSKGSKWFNLPAQELTEEVKADLEVLKMRSVLNPKQFYKKNDLSVLPKFFQVGKVMDNKLDFYSDRLTKKERKRTLVDELLDDAEFTKYNKKKYKEIIEEKHKFSYKHSKKNRKKF